MVREVQLSSLLGELAERLVVDAPVQEVLETVVARLVEVLPVVAAGATLVDRAGSPSHVAASDLASLRLERLQAELGEGPGRAALDLGAVVSVADLAVDDRFPAFSSAARAAGLAGVVAVPLHHDDVALGALSLYRSTGGPLTSDDLGAARTVAGVASAYLRNAEEREASRLRAQHLQHLALHDPLTGLPNRALLFERLSHAAQRADRSHTDAAVLFADLDSFKAVNDTFGHRIGDELLVAVARRLARLVRPGDTLARVCGDEFVVLCEDLRSRRDADALARRLRAAFDRPFLVAGRTIPIGASVGTAYAGSGADISPDLLARADAAMYDVKREGRLRSPAADGHRDPQPGARQSLAGDLRAASVGGELDVAYQPVVRSADGTVTGVEALVRWSSPARGEVPARTLVEVAERSGLITEIGAWMLERSCRDRRRWLDDHPGAPLDLAVNVSARQLGSPGFSGTVERVLAATGMDPTALVLELTETMSVEEFQPIAPLLVALRALGIRIALDDFGTGHSSLSHLRRLPVDIVKIDRAFIADIDVVPTGGTIVAAVTTMAHALGLQVIAEGVETLHQDAVVTGIGCDGAQGFAYARPMPAARIATALDTAADATWSLPLTPGRLARVEGCGEAPVVTLQVVGGG